MKRDVIRKNSQDAELFPFAPIRRRFLIFCIVCVLAVLFSGACLTVRRMRQSAEAAYQSASAQISQRVGESIKLLTSLAALPEFYDPDVPWESKTAKLDEINQYFGYMFICYVDEDIEVYTLGEEAASLASREYMQTLYSTREIQVTDGFVAGADGRTLNYTVAVPLIQDDVMTGSLFCSIYFDDAVNLLKQSAAANGAEAVLIGSKGQIMSSTGGLAFGSSYTEILHEYKLVGLTTDKLETLLLARDSGSFRSLKAGNSRYTVFGPIENTNWDILVTVDFLSLFSAELPSLLLAALFQILITLILYLFVKKHIFGQLAIMENLLTSIHKMEKKLYSNAIAPESVDYEDILQMSSKGLRDELTGLATRTFFLNQLEKLLRDGNASGKLSLCFVDLDDLKLLNDTYGHEAGDSALKKIGFILRGYEKKYEGVVGRYGGDEFILILKDIDSVEELNDVLSELVERLHFTITVNGTEIPVHCSMGACVWNRKDTLKTLISKADKALYDVKRHGKGTYSLFLNGE